MAKKLEELGISPWPWHTFEDNWVESADGNPAMSNAAFACNQNDALLIAAAPDLYEACLASLDYIEEFTDSLAQDIREALEAALAKASGEEVAK